MDKAHLDAITEPTTTPATENSAVDFSIDYPLVAEQLKPLTIAAIEQYSMVIPSDSPIESISLAKAIIQGKLPIEKVAKIFLAGLPESYPQIIGVINCVRYEQRFNLTEMAKADRHKLLAAKAVEHIAALPAEANEMPYHLANAWPGLAARLVD